MLRQRKFFFFFQAEDGIRDGHVTGVQTCALPISRGCHWGGTTTVTFHRAGQPANQILDWEAASARNRSEERRVGKSVDLGGRRIMKKKKEKQNTKELQ